MAARGHLRKVVAVFYAFLSFQLVNVMRLFVCLSICDSANTCSSPTQLLNFVESVSSVGSLSELSSRIHTKWSRYNRCTSPYLDDDAEAIRNDNGLKDGCISTLKGSCTVVQDFTDFCFHSYFSYMDEPSEEIYPEEKLIEVKLSKLPSCILVSPLAIPVDVPFVIALALWKSSFMLFMGWKRRLEDLIGREGLFLEMVCVPFVGFAIFLWPLAVTGSVVASFFSSFALALYNGVVVIRWFDSF